MFAVLPSARKGPFLGIVSGVVALAMTVGFAVYRLQPRAPAPALAVAQESRVPDALGASLARSFAGLAQQTLRTAGNAPAAQGCSAALATGDAAAYRAAEDARLKDRNTQSLPLIFAAEDAYMAAARTCLRPAWQVCAATPRIGGCDQILRVREADLATIRSLRTAHGG